MSPLAQQMTHFFSLGTIGLQILFIILLGVYISGRGGKIEKFVKEHYLLIGLVLTVGATLGSFFYSEVAALAPCTLCWYQRILLFPQAILFIVAFARKDAGVWVYSLWLSVIGVIIAVYHNYLQFGGTEIVPCSVAQVGPACTAVQFIDFAYITLPMMSLTIFVVLIILAMISRRRNEMHDK